MANRMAGALLILPAAIFMEPEGGSGKHSVVINSIHP